jgi:hypothetical protein
MIAMVLPLDELCILVCMALHIFINPNAIGLQLIHGT